MGYIRLIEPIQAEMRVLHWYWLTHGRICHAADVMGIPASHADTHYTLQVRTNKPESMLTVGADDMVAACQCAIIPFVNLDFG
jgi:hypothetical protein